MTASKVSDLDSRYELFIDGKKRSANSGEWLTTYDPATEEPLTEVASGHEKDVNDAVSAASEAQDSWSSVSPDERGRVLEAFAEALLENKEYIATAETLEAGKPYSQAKEDIEGAAKYFRYYAGAADKIHGETIQRSDEYVTYSVREPYGVSAHIVPWNFPIDIFARSVAPAIAAGNAAVVKPAEQTSISALLAAEFACDSGLPPGVLNVVPGFGATAGAPLAGHPDIDILGFTGSDVTGRKVASMALDNTVLSHLELGGKNPQVVFTDADMEAAIESTLLSIFTVNSGQVCSSGDRLIVQEEIHDEFVDRLVSRVEDLELGAGINDPDMGPVIGEDQYDKVLNYIEIGREEVGEPITGGEALERPGYFITPTVFDDVPNSARIAQEEIFGPVLPIITFETESEAIEIANDTDYGLVAGVHTSNAGRSQRFAREAEAGQVFINQWFAGGTETPFGGYKRSGFGREKGMEGLESYTQLKTVCQVIE